MVERRRIARANLYEITDSGFRCEDEIRYNDYEPTHHTQLFPYEVSITQKRVKDYKLVRTYWQARLSTDITDKQWAQVMGFHDIRITAFANIIRTMERNYLHAINWGPNAKEVEGKLKLLDELLEDLQEQTLFLDSQIRMQGFDDAYHEELEEKFGSEIYKWW